MAGKNYILSAGLDLDAASGRPLRIGSAYGCAPAVLVAELAAASAVPVTVIAPSVAEAEDFVTQLRFFMGHAGAAMFPDPETLPYDRFSPHHDLVSRRLLVLSRLLRTPPTVTVVAAPTLLHRLPPRDYIRSNSIELATRQTIAIAALQSDLAESGYERVSQVTQHGEFAVRGSLIDLYPMGSDLPVRIDFFDDEIETLRLFDPESQLSGERIDTLALLPARDFPTTDQAISEFRTRYRQRFEGNPADSLIYQEVSERRFPGGVEYYLPLFFERTENFWDFLPADTRLVTLGSIDAALQSAWEQAEQRYEQYRHDRERPILAPDEIFVPVAEHQQALEARKPIAVHQRELPVGSPEVTNLPASAAPALLIQSHAEQPASALVGFLNSTSHRTLICAESAGRREVILELLRNNGIAAETVENWQGFIDTSAKLCLVVAPLPRGAVFAGHGLCILAESELYGTRPAKQKRRRVRDPEAILSDLADLHEGAPVVHADYGVGRYRGLSHLTIDTVPGDFLTLEYAGGDLLHVPVGSLQLISRYTGTTADHAPLHRLGTDQWVRAKRKAAEQVRDVAAEMLDLYATRAARKGRRFQPSQSDYAAFASDFPFELTEDQAAAIDATLADLASAQPMDRLICGDVGFGKTEVALRAAFAVAICGGQVAVMAPTTLLAQQHFQTFSDRFAEWPVNVEVLSRFRTTRESKQVLAGLGDGKVDIVIGTHKLLQQDVKFSNLGLVIVDEEHRFGVRQKERLKSLRAEVDILTLTATPIPRTLNMAMGQLRELSLITTPPESRLAIKTFVTQWQDSLLREACQRELKRGGQVFFVHNRIEDIEKQARRLGELMPEASIRVAHGQMREQELEQIMLDFYHRRFHILVCTAIIESGIDIPSANTIIINRADRFGLAQLHQLRGRVGRSHHKAFAYLFAPPDEAITPDARKRLDAIEAMEDLGAGFVLATHDLEIRGAGELLGEQQTGQIQQIGFSLYTQMLGQAVRAIRRGETPDLDATRALGPEVNMRLPALLPEDYLPDVQMRLTHYKRIASAPSDAALRDLQTELIDRFGMLPDATRTLFRQTRLRLQASQLGLEKIEASAGGVSITFGKHTTAEPTTIVALVQSDPRGCNFNGTRLNIAADLEDPDERFAFTEQLIGRLSVGAEPVNERKTGS